MKTFIAVIIALALLSTLIGCKKDFATWQQPISIGTVFNFDIGSNSLKSLTKPDGQVPTNPFKVDSVAVNAYETYNGYWCTSANGLVYVLPPTDIMGHIVR